MKKEDSAAKLMRLKVIKRTRAFNIISQLLGIGPMSLKSDTVKPHSIYQIIYTVIILSMFLFELVYIVIYHEIIQGSKYSITNLTHIFNLFAENIISCVCLIHSLVFSKMACENFKSSLRVLGIFCRLNFDLDFVPSRKSSILFLVVTYAVIFQAGFTLDYYLLFGDTDKKYISFQSWVFYVIHVCFNAFALLYLVFLLQILRVQFKALNSAMKDLNSISEQNLVSEMQVLSLKKTKPAELPQTERVLMMKEAHDRLYRICANGWISQNQVALLEIVTSGILITSYLYSLISMLIDDQIDSTLMIYCSYWILYRFFIIVVLVVSYDGVCKQCNQMEIMIHDILNRGETREIYIQLKNFSLQRLHQKLQIMACSLFAIDNSLLFEVSGAITNYLVILIQFKVLGDSNKSQSGDKGLNHLLKG